MLSGGHPQQPPAQSNRRYKPREVRRPLTSTTNSAIAQNNPRNTPGHNPERGRSGSLYGYHNRYSHHLKHQHQRNPTELNEFKPFNTTDLSPLHSVPKFKNFRARPASADGRLTDNNNNSIYNYLPTQYPVPSNKQAMNVEGKPRPNSAAHQVRNQLFLQKKLDKNVELHHRPLVRPQSAKKDADSGVKRVFDPMQDRHLWTMWRTAVTARIVDEVRRLENDKKKNGQMTPVDNGKKDSSGVYGTALVTPPLRSLIKLGEGSKEMALQLGNQDQGILRAIPFIYFGLPRACVVKKDQGVAKRNGR